MIPNIMKNTSPQWLDQLNGLDYLPIRDLLQGSLYYPSSGRDGDPVMNLAGLVHSFVYVDYGLTHDEVWDSIHDPRHHFKGYDVLACRDVAEAELIPAGRPPLELLPMDGNPLKYRDIIKKPFAIWCVLKRKPNYDDNHGPPRISLLYLGADGAAAFGNLYHGNRCTPAVIALVQSGEGFGFNWTQFIDPDLILGRLVLDNPSGRPDYLLYGGWGRRGYYQDSCWPQYSDRVHYWKSGHHYLGLWRPLPEG